MREILSLHIGQAGNQIGFSIWELLCAEHGIDRDGTVKNRKDDSDRTFSSFFLESHCGKFVPRGLFIDLEPSVINQLRSGSYRGLYNPNQLINGMDDSSGNFSRAFNTMGRLIYRPIENKLRKQIESCDFLQSMLFYRSLAGGSGSGLTSMIFELLEDYVKTIRFELPIHPSPHFDSCVVGPYNSILGEHFCMEECDVGLLLDNEALFDICCNILNVKHPTMTTINRILGQVNSNLTASSRYNSDMFNDINAVLTNLVPYPRIHFPLISFAPLGNYSKIEHDSNSITDLTRSVFERDHQLINCDPTNGKYMACSLVYRGLVNTCEIFSTLSILKSSRHNRFVDWCPTGFKVGIVDQPPLILPQSNMGDTNCSVVMLTNTSSVSAVWQRLAQKFHRLYAKRSFIHWFVSEGLEESEFCEALYNLATLARDYEEVSIDTKLLQTNIDKTDLGNVGEEGEGEGPKVVINGGEGEGEGGEEGNEVTNSSNINSNCNEKRFYDRLAKYDWSDMDQNINENQRKVEMTSPDKSEILNLNSNYSINSEIFIKQQILNDGHFQVSNKFLRENSLKFNNQLINESNKTKENFNINNFKMNLQNLINESDDEDSNLLNTLVSKTLIV